MEASYASKIAPFTPKKESEQKEKPSSTTAATTPCACAGARAREAFGRLIQYYCEAFGRRSCPPSIQRAMFEALKEGMYAKTIMLCIDAAQEAERPTWAYAAAVMRRCIAEGALTPEAFEERSARHGARQGGGMNYPQRSYTDEEFAALTGLMDDI